jgi:hypothetical protein
MKKCDSSASLANGVAHFSGSMHPKAKRILRKRTIDPANLFLDLASSRRRAIISKVPTNSRVNQAPPSRPLSRTYFHPDKLVAISTAKILKSDSLFPPKWDGGKQVCHECRSCRKVPQDIASIVLRQ